MTNHRFPANSNKKTQVPGALSPRLEELTATVVNRLSPSNIKRTATEYVTQWEQSMADSALEGQPGRPGEKKEVRDVEGMKGVKDVEGMKEVKKVDGVRENGEGKENASPLA